MKNVEIPVVELPMKLRFGEQSQTDFGTEEEVIKVTMIDYPRGDFRLNCHKQIMSTWADKPITEDTGDKYETFRELITGKTLPNSMEGLKFTFLMEGLTHIEISHVLRHRVFSSVHALCSGDRDLRMDPAMIPESIAKSEFGTKYMDLTEKCKDLYAEMVDSKEISLMDARYILNRNHTYYYYFTMNLKDAIAFINQRKCTQIQPYADNLLAQGVYENIIKIIPELKEVLSLNCDGRCHYIRTANTGKATNLYWPDKAHNIFDWNPDNFIYKKERHEMGIPKTWQDE